MKLTPQQTEMVAKKIENFLGSDCDCGHKEWILNDKIFELKEFVAPVDENSRTVFPCVVVTCKKCGKTHFFSAVILGALG